MELRTGRIGENATDRSIRKRIQSTSVRTDGHLFPVQNGYGVCSNSASDATAEMAVIKAVNGLSRKGCRAEYINAVMLLPVGSQEEILRSIVDEITGTCRQWELKIGDIEVEVSPAVNRPVTMASAYGSVFSDFAWSPVSEGQSIVMTKWAAVEGTFLLSTILSDRLEDAFPVAMLHRTKKLRSFLSVQKEAEIAAKSRNAGISAMVNAGDGGIFAALWELSRATGKGLRVDLKKIPVLQETVEYANHLDLNPYQMKSEGSLLITAGEGDALAGELRQQGISASVIGQLTGGRDKLIVNGDETRHLDLPQPDALLGLLLDRMRQL